MANNSNETKNVRFETRQTDTQPQVDLAAVITNTVDGNKKALEHSISFEQPPSKVADGGLRAWLVCVATMWSYGIIMGNEFNYALIYDKLITVYNDTPNHVTYAAWIGSLELGIESLLYLPSAVCIDLFGARLPAFFGTSFQALALFISAFIEALPLYILTQSLILGIGQAFLTEATYSILPHYFDKKLGMANGLMNLGSSVITVIFIMITSRILKNLGLQISFFILTGIALTTIASSILFKSVLETDHQSEKFCSKVRESCNVKILRKSKFLVWGISSFIGLFGTKIPPVTINHLATVLFPEVENSEMANIVFTAMTGIGGIVFGKLLDYANFSHIYFHAMAYFVYGVAQIALVHSPSFTWLVIIYGIYGVGNGIYFTCLTPVSVQVCGSPTLAAQGIGYYFLFAAVPLILGPVIAGNLFERLGSYNAAYYFGAGMCFICCIMQLLYPDGIIYRKIRKFCLKRLKIRLPFGDDRK